MNSAVISVIHHAAWSSGAGSGTVVRVPFSFSASPATRSAAASSSVPSQTTSAATACLPCGT